MTEIEHNFQKSEDPADIVRKAKDTLRAAMAGSGAYHMNSCVKCGLCGESCHIWKTDPVPENLPGTKASRVISHYRRYHTFLGKVAPFFVGARDITPEALDELVEIVYGRCTACGRCGINCSIGVDVGSIIRIGRNILAEVGKVPPNLQAVVNNQLTTGNQMSITSDELKSTAEWISEDLQLEMGTYEVGIPVDEPGKKLSTLSIPGK
jgi:Fe-S oxidoreductase